MKCSSSKAKNQHLTFNLTPLKQNVLFDSSSALTIGILFYFIFLLIICTETFTRTFHYIMNSPKVFYLNLRMMAWSRRNVILLYCCFLFLRIPVALESHRSSQEGGGGVRTPYIFPLDPPLMSLVKLIWLLVGQFPREPFSPPTKLVIKLLGDF